MIDADAVVAQIPSSFFIIVGGLILANLGALVSIFYGVGKLIWWLAKLESRVQVVETEHTKDINNAFQKIRDLEQSRN